MRPQFGLILLKDDQVPSPTERYCSSALIANLTRLNTMTLQLSPSISSSSLGDDEHRYFAVANRPAVPTTAGRRSDRDIATDVVACLRSVMPRLCRGVVPIIRMGEVSLLGHVESDLQRLDAQRAVQRVRGVRTVIDLMVLRPETKAHAIRLHRGQ